VSACSKKDNYSPPNALLTGAVMYKGDSIYLEYNRVPYQLYQFGFGKVGSIDGSFTQEGTYAAVLFNGSYKLIIPNGQGPFKWKQLASGAPDSMAITLNGNQTLDLEVTPYYMIRTPAITGGAGKVSATFKAEKIITDASAKNIERVTLYINKTQFVSGANNIAKIDLAGAGIADPNNIQLSVTVPNIAPQTYVYARIGLKIESVEDLIFSPVKQITY